MFDDEGLFGDLFDLNGDGSVDCVEKAVEFGAFTSMVQQMEKDNRDDDTYDTDENTFDNSEDEFFEDNDDDDDAEDF